MWRRLKYVFIFIGLLIIGLVATICIRYSMLINHDVALNRYPASFNYTSEECIRATKRLDMGSGFDVIVSIDYRFHEKTKEPLEIMSIKSVQRGSHFSPFDVYYIQNNAHAEIKYNEQTMKYEIGYHIDFNFLLGFFLGNDNYYGISNLRSVDDKIIIPDYIN